MDISKDIVHGNLTALKAQREQIVANLNAVNGAINILEALISQAENAQPAAGAVEDPDDRAC